MPRITSTAATPLSSHLATGSLMVSFSASTTPLAAIRAAACPIPQNAPTSDDRQMLFCSLAIVDTATTWSGSSAWRIPNKKPTPATVQIHPFITIARCSFRSGEADQGPVERDENQQDERLHDGQSQADLEHVAGIEI